MKRFLLLAITWFAAAVAQGAPWPDQCVQTIATGQTISGSLASTDCPAYFDESDSAYYTDIYAFSGTQGQQIAITMTSGSVDAYLELHASNDADGDALESNDDSGDGTDARIPAESGYFTLPATGTYYIWASSVFALETGAYTVTLTEPGSSPWPSRCVQEIRVGQTVSGTLDTNDCFLSDPPSRYYTDLYSFSGTRGQQIAIGMDSTALDTWLELHIVNNVNSTPLYTGDDQVGTNSRIPDHAGYYTLPETATYYISASTALDGETGAYMLRLTEGNRLTATEFYHPAFNHYFITAYQDEAASLSAGNLPPWVPTGLTFEVWGGAGTFIDNVWRFFSASFAPLSGHFYTNSPVEAETLQRGNVWALEASDAFFMMASPDGTCPFDSRPLYRLYNDGQGGAPNHRYTIDPAIRAQMIAANWIPEGNGPDGVFACVPL